VEGYNFDLRKQLLEYDDIANEQRHIIYEQRNEVLESDDISDTISRIRTDIAEKIVAQYVPPQSYVEQWDIEQLTLTLERDFALKLPIANWLESNADITGEEIRERILTALDEHAKQKQEAVTPEVMRQLEKGIMLQWLDQHWREHLGAMDYLRRGIHLRGYAQKNPKQEYKREAFELLSGMLETLKFDIVSLLAKVEVEVDSAEKIAHQEVLGNVEYQHDRPSTLQQAEEQETETQQPFVRGEKKQGRNDPCACGSGKKYKHCHGQLA